MLCLSGCELYSRWVLLITVGNRVKIYNVACKTIFCSCRLKFPMKNCRQMSDKFKANDLTN